jgi:hypothetical protein
METITITRALAELKLLNDRIEKKISGSEFVFISGKKNKHNINTETLISNSKSNYQSIEDLIARRHKIKSAIILSNATTRVKVGNKEMTVAEVIERRQNIDYYKLLCHKLRMNRDQVLNSVERQNQTMEGDLQRLLEANFGKTSSVKTNSDDIENLSKAYREHNRAEMVDGIDIDKRIEEVEAIIEELETEANFVLSESNALTKITI